MVNFFLWIIGGLSGIAKVFQEILQMYRDKTLIDQGRKQAEAEIAAKINAEQQEILRKQQEILMQERTKAELEKKFEDGKF